MIKSLTVQPNPIACPESVSVSAQIQTSDPLNAPQKVELTVQKEMASFSKSHLWGQSVAEPDISDMLDVFIPLGESCPEPLHFPATVPSEKASPRCSGMISLCPTWSWLAGSVPGITAYRTSSAVLRNIWAVSRSMFL